MHGSEVLYEVVTANTTIKRRLNYTILRHKQGQGTPVTAGYGQRVDVIDFGKTGNSSKTLN